MPDSRIDPARLVQRLAAVEPAAGAEPGAVRVVRAPGRVNLIGEHTDYNEGFVLPIAIDLAVTIAFIPTDDRRVTLTLDEDGRRVDLLLDGLPAPSGGWEDYVVGTAWAMTAAGVPVRGFRGLLASDLPQGAGLSSSAALELASALALSGGDEPPVDRLTLARIAQRAENEFVGVQCGLMDQFASACGVEGSAVLLDCRSHEDRALPLDLDDTAIIVTHTGFERRLEASAYNERRAQCAAAVSAVAQRFDGVEALRDVTPAMLEEIGDGLEPTLARRARHVVDENTRVLEAAVAFEGGDHGTVGRLFGESHASLRDLYEVSSPELDALVEIAGDVPGVFGSRLTGAGFGGCTVTLVRREAVPRLMAAIEKSYPTRTGLTPRLFEVTPAAGAGRVDGWH